MARRRFSIKATIEGEDQASPAIRQVQTSLTGLAGFMRTGLQRSLSAATRGFARFGRALKARMVITLGDVVRLAQSAFRALGEAADLRGQTRSLQAQLNAQGIALDGFLAKLTEVARGTISQADLVRSSSQALLLGIPAEEIAALLDIARVSAIATGRSTTEAFNDIATGVGRASPMILDNLGLILKLGPAYEVMAQQLGKSVTELTVFEQKQAILNEVLKVGGERVALFGDTADATSEVLQKSKAAVEDLRVTFGDFVNRGLTVVAGALQKMKAALVSAQRNYKLLKVEVLEFAAAALKSGAGLADFGKVLPFIGESLGNAGAEMRELARGFTFGARDALIAAAGLEKTRVEAEEMAAAAFKAAFASDELDDKLGGMATRAGEAEVTIIGLDGSVQQLGASTDAATEAVQNFDARTNVAITNMQRLEGQVVRTAAAFDELARRQGVAAATQAAIEGGGTLVNKGTRVRLPGGGSRLTSPPGLNP